MIEMHKILELSQQIAEAFEPERIILFGSYADGTPTEDSDVGLLVQRYDRLRAQQRESDRWRT